MLAVLAAIALSVAGAARAGVAIPQPGAMAVTGLPSQLRAGHTLTLREVMPMAVWHGHVQFQRETPAGGWRTLATAAISPRVFGFTGSFRSARPAPSSSSASYS